MQDKRIIASLGLISDTHFKDRLFELPHNLAQLWQGVDLLLHAGDVGDLSVLDHLGRLAPVVAVHGNDEPEGTTRALPGQQLIAVGGLRLLLWHSHYADPVEEKANRPGAWGPKLERIANHGREWRARVVVYGHTHVPMTSRHDEVVLVNPGALASGSFFTRQQLPSLARLHVFEDESCEVVHFNLATGQPEAFAAARPDEDFSLLGSRSQAWIVEPDLIPDVAALGKLTYEDIQSVVRSLTPLYRRSLAGGPMRRNELVEAVRCGEQITPDDRMKILEVIERQK
jgi:putative phosphoesterase